MEDRAASPATARPVLSASELYDAQAARATFERLADVINAQSAALERLTRRVATLETTQCHAVAAQQLTLQQADAMATQLEKVEVAQEKAEAERRRQQTRVDELVLVVSRDAKLLEATSDRLARVESMVERALRELKQEMAPLDLVTRLQDAQDVVLDRIAAIDMRLDSKLDKSEMSRLDGVVGKIQAFAPTATQLTSRVDQIEEAQQSTNRRLQREEERTSQLGRGMDQLQLDLQRKVDAESWHEFRDVTFETALQKVHTSANATSALVNELVQRGVLLETSQRTLSSKLTSMSKALAAELTNLRADITAEMDKKLDRGEIQQSLKDIRHELSCKAWRKDTQAMSDELARLVTSFNKTVQQVALSTRFLNWYATRGESYERNLDVVENQLERLAFASAPQLREPFGDQVRYSR